MKIRVKPKWVAWLVRIFITVLYATLRVRFLDVERVREMDDRGQQYIATFWHGHLPLMVYVEHRKPIAVMVSQHRDGELMALTMGLFGVDLVRGSSTRGGAAALRAMVREAELGKNLAFTPDGPRGPRRIVQPGVVRAAQMTGLPIQPVVVSAERKRVLSSWDGMEIPLPFSRVLFAYGVPLFVTPDAHTEAARLDLEQRMIALAETVDSDFDTLWPRARRARRKYWRRPAAGK